MPDPIAFFLTWTCYSSRLHGDERGSVDASHNRRGTPYLKPSPNRESARRAQCRHDEIVLNGEARKIVTQAIEDHAAYKNWQLRAVNARSNHVHVIVICPPNGKPEPMMSQFKAWATRRLRETGHVQQDQPVWTEHGSTIWLNRAEDVDAKTDYVNRLQDEPERFDKDPRV